MMLVLSACGSARKPSETDIAAYLSQGAPDYVQLGTIATHFEAAAVPLPPGSWRLQIAVSAKAQEDLYALASGANARRLDFEQRVSEVEQYRTKRIEAVNDYAAKMGLLKAGAASPEPALPIVLTHKAGQEMTEHVVLIAEPDGVGWKFLPAEAAPEGSAAIGEPLDALRRHNALLTLVIADSPEDREAQARERAFLSTLAKAPRP